MVDLFIFRDPVELDKDEEVTGRNGNTTRRYDHNDVRFAIASSSMEADDIDWDTEESWDPNAVAEIEDWSAAEPTIPASEIFKVIGSGLPMPAMTVPMTPRTLALGRDDISYERLTKS